MEQYEAEILTWLATTEAGYTSEDIARDLCYRWQYVVGWLFDVLDRGLVARDETTGLWSLTDAGRAALAHKEETE